MGEHVSRSVCERNRVRVKSAQIACAVAIRSDSAQLHTVRSKKYCITYGKHRIGKTIFSVPLFRRKYRGWQYRPDSSNCDCDVALRRINATATGKLGKLNSQSAMKVCDWCRNEGIKSNQFVSLGNHLFHLVTKRRTYYFVDSAVNDGESEGIEFIGKLKIEKYIAVQQCKIILE